MFGRSLVNHSCGVRSDAIVMFRANEKQETPDIKKFIYLFIIIVVVAFLYTLLFWS
jgi:hypothetical protein